MNENLEGIVQKVKELASDIGSKAADTFEIQKLKGEIRLLKRGNNRDFKDIGTIVYDKYSNSEEVDAAVLPLCETVKNREAQIAELQEKIDKINAED
ncbi:MAG: hypothetical protein LBQ95_08225 [Lachnospiraceae bacterium]|jgi:hypothetical protein|nr:hypothetical protein [Lachnospiraceae bacterium]